MTIKALYRRGGIYIRITHNRLSRFKLITKIDKKFWNGSVIKSHPQSSAINTKIANIIQRYTSIAYDFDIKEVDYHVDDLLKGKIGIVRLDMACIDYIKELRTKNKHKSIRKFNNLLDKVDIIGNMDIQLIDDKIMSQYQDRLMALENINSFETVHRYLNMIKTLIRANGGNSKAISFKAQRTESTKAKLTKDEFKKIELLNNDKVELSRDVFISLVYAWGCRIGDMLMMRADNIKSDHLEYLEQKSSFRKLKRVKINKKLAAMIGKYSGVSNYDYIFPVLKKSYVNPNEDQVYGKHIESKTTIINRDLKLIAAMCNIDKKLSTHVARHTTAYWAAKANMTTNDIKDLLNHSKFSTTENYIKTLTKDDRLGSAMDDLLDF